jgi:hypothetical protein
MSTITETTTAHSSTQPAKLILSGSSPIVNGNHAHKSDLSTNPFERVWRGNREGTIRMPGVPTFTDKHEERRWVKEHMAAGFRYWGKLGFGEGTAGHVTVRDPVLNDHYWMNPFGMHFSLIKVCSISLYPRSVSWVSLLICD